MPEQYFLTDSLLPDGSVLPTSYYKKEQTARKKTGPEQYLHVIGRPYPDPGFIPGFFYEPALPEEYSPQLFLEKMK